MLNLDEPQPVKPFSLFNSGFRVFFLAAGWFAVISMLLWFLNYSLNLDIGLTNWSSLDWHAHEMVYGYGMAAVSGFLLTAMTNWTAKKTLTGLSLMVVSLFWLLARISPFINLADNMFIMFVFDSLFFIVLLIGLIRPIILSRQWQHFVVVIPVILLFFTNTIFYMGQLDFIQDGVRIGLYAGVYLLLLLVFVLARRVIPFFIEKGVDTDFKPTNYLWLDRVMIPLLFLYALCEVFLIDQIIIAFLAVMLFVLNMIRLSGWYTKAIWKKPLLWVLLAAYFSITMSFGLRSLSFILEIHNSLSLHLLQLGGIGMVTVGMMARVALGHTGRNVFEPHALIKWVFVFLLVALVFRVVLPLFTMTYYSEWILFSQVFWIMAFSLFVILYSALLIVPRVDGRFG